MVYYVRMGNLKIVAAAVSPEVAEAIAAYARRHGITQSQAAHQLMAAGAKLKRPAVRPVGRPARTNK